MNYKTRGDGFYKWPLHLNFTFSKNATSTTRAYARNVFRNEKLLPELTKHAGRVSRVGVEIAKMTRYGTKLITRATRGRQSRAVRPMRSGRNVD